ncbi:MAG: imidazolonepropionase [Negativicutes bacterium]|nr:imidazolonepropionase [Negativicutes bacterium]
MDFILHNIGTLVSCAGHGSEPITGEALQDAGVQSGMAVAVKDGLIYEVGREKAILTLADARTKLVDAEGRLVMPGFVDPHTHLVYAGDRAHEWALKQQGVAYLEILRQGGGILNSVAKTRAAGKQALKQQTARRLQGMLQGGITTVEIKSGYGLDLEHELLQLQIMAELNGEQAMDIVPTFMGAHATPTEYLQDPGAYVDLVINEMLPAVAKQGIARFCDVFCETGVFSPADAKRILLAGMQYGLRAKVHADELAVSGGSALAAEIRAISADHLLETTDEAMAAMARAKVIGVCLPATSFNLANGKYARARRMIELGMAIALSTDANPGSSPTENMQFVLSLACLYLKLTPAEAILAATLNAAHAIGRADRVGSLEAGKQADLVLMDAPSLEYLPYHFAMNHVHRVYKRGLPVV